MMRSPVPDRVFVRKGPAAQRRLGDAAPLATKFFSPLASRTSLVALRLCLQPRSTSSHGTRSEAAPEALECAQALDARQARRHLGAAALDGSAQAARVHAAHHSDEKQAEVRAHGQGGEVHPHAAAREGGQQGEDRPHLPRWLHGCAEPCQASPPRAQHTEGLGQQRSPRRGYGELSGAQRACGAPRPVAPQRPWPPVASDGRALAASPSSSAPVPPLWQTSAPLRSPPAPLAPPAAPQT